MQPKGAADEMQLGGGRVDSVVLPPTVPDVFLTKQACVRHLYEPDMWQVKTHWPFKTNRSRERPRARETQRAPNC